MLKPDRTGPIWRKSSRSGLENCVEVAFLERAVLLRDSKDPDGPVLTFTHAEWKAFLAGLSGLRHAADADDSGQLANSRGWDPPRRAR